MALPPRLEPLLELEESGGVRRQLAIDRGGEPCSGPSGAGGDAPGARRLVVVHWAPPAIAEDDERRAQLAARAAAFLPLRHPNLVSTFEVVSDRGRCHWLGEFVPGEPLSRLLRQTRRGRRALSTRQIILILAGVARALEHAHGAVDAAGQPRPVVHRQLRPESVLVSYGGVVKLSADIGVCSPERAAALAPHGAELVGDPRCDIHALGAILREALAGAAALPGGEELGLDGACPSVLPEVAALVRRALSTDPGDRHQSMSELREELEELAQLDALKNEPKLLFGFMCNFFFEEYSALEALLEEHSLAHALLDPRAVTRAGSHVSPAGAGRARPAARPLSQSGTRPTLRAALLGAMARPIERTSGERDPGRHLSLLQSGLRRRPEASALAAAHVPPRANAQPANAHGGASAQPGESAQPKSHLLSAAALSPEALVQPAILPAQSPLSFSRLRFARLRLSQRLLPFVRKRGLPQMALGALALAGAVTALGSAGSAHRARDTARVSFEEAPAAPPGAPAELAAAVQVERASAAIGRFLPIPLGPVMTVETRAAASAARSPTPSGSVPTVELEGVAAARSARAPSERSVWSRVRSARSTLPPRSKRRDSEPDPSAPIGSFATRNVSTRNVSTRNVATRYVATLTELDEPSADATGIDLRTSNERPPRAIDTQNPYLP